MFNYKSIYGFKVHRLISLDGYLTENLQFSMVIGDKGYAGDKLALDLKSENCVNIISLKRNNSNSLVPKRFYASCGNCNPT